MPHLNDPPVTERPIYWFVILEQSLDRGDFDMAAEAKRQLERLGVNVNHQPKHSKAKGGNHVS